MPAMDVENGSCPRCGHTHLCAAPAPTSTHMIPALARDPEVRRYVREQLALVEPGVPWTPAENLYRHYRYWCYDHHILVAAQRTFAHALWAGGYSRRRTPRSLWSARVR